MKPILYYGDDVGSNYFSRILCIEEVVPGELVHYLSEDALWGRWLLKISDIVTILRLGTLRAVVTVYGCGLMSMI